LLKKHHMLALLSALRLHKVQTMMNLRQTLEAGAAAAYAIANPEIQNFVDVHEDGTLDPSKDLTVKRYKWLAANYPHASDVIKEKKELINNTTSHANIVTANQTFRVNESGDTVEAPFFDIEDDYHVKIDLWLTSSVAIDLMSILYKVNESLSVIEFVQNFPAYLGHVAAENAVLRAEIRATERYKRAVEKTRK
jgi:hypothetical protein